jgi:site-specific recombinase XerD
VRVEQTPADTLIEEFLTYLREHRGIAAASTFERYGFYCREFLRSIGDRATPARLREVTPDDLRRFLTARCEALSRSERTVVCIALRALLRFARVRGYLFRDLVSAVPTIPRYALDRVPPVFARKDMERTIAVIDTRTPKALRDRALLLVLATYGMRICQIKRLRVDDLDWRQQTIRFRAAKGGRAVVLPLTVKVGEALVAWLKIRPQVPHREVFLRMRAPLRPLTSNLYMLIERYARKAGVDAPIVGSRTWRHGCATHMLERGQSLKTIRDMLGHRSIESTFIYTKVDLPALRQAALDWPGEAS